jgi:hypothetical protein
MKRLLTAAAIGAGLAIVGFEAVPAFAADAPAPEYATIHLDTTVNAPIDQVWAKVGPFCAVQDWLKQLAPCVQIGDGGVGSQRKLGARGFVEVEVAATRYSYTYAQPNNAILYHGTLSAEPIDQGHTRLMYTLIWDDAPDGDQAAKDKDKAGRAATFTAALASMKALAEGK